MIQAELKYRDYVPMWTIASEFAHLRFSGDATVKDLLERICSLIEFEKYDKQKAVIDCLKCKQESNLAKVNVIKRRILDIKKQHKVVIFNKEAISEIKRNKEQITKLLKENESIDKEIAKLEDSCFFEVYELKIKFKDMLTHFGFSCKSSHHNEDKIIDTEIYEFNGDEKALAEKAKVKIKELEDKLENDINNIKNTYNKPQKKTTELEK